MKSEDIGWIISVILWLIAVIIGRSARKEGELFLAHDLYVVEVVSLTAMWFFIGKQHGWW